MPTLTDAQIALAYDMETVAEALAGGYVLPPDPRRKDPSPPKRVQTENDLTYRDRVEAWRKAENAKIAAMLFPSERDREAADNEPHVPIDPQPV